MKLKKVLLNKKRMGQSRGKLKGFTLIELLIAIAIIGIISGMGYYTYQKQLQRERITNHVHSFSSDIYQAKTKSLMQNIPYGLKMIPPDSYTIFYIDTMGVQHDVIGRKFKYVSFGSLPGVSSCPDGSAIDMSDGINFLSNTIIFLPIGTPLSNGCVVIKRPPYLGAVVITPSGDIQSFIYIKGNWIKK